MALSKKKKADITNPSLKTWDNLQLTLKIATEDECKDLLQQEKRGRGRFAFLSRIHSRYNVLRGMRERIALTDFVKG